MIDPAENPSEGGEKSVETTGKPSPFPPDDTAGVDPDYERFFDRPRPL